MLTIEQTIRDSLPIPPYRYKYRVTQQSPQVWRVDLIHPDQYSYTTEQVVTVWGFIKGDKVYPPLNYTKPRKTAVCNLLDISDDMSYTSIIPTSRSLNNDF